MSFILDALKKSENARQRQAGPALFEVKVTPPRRSLPVWAIIIGILLVVTGIELAWVLLQRGGPQPVHAARSAAPAAQTTAPPPLVPAMRPTAAHPALAGAAPSSAVTAAPSAGTAVVPARAPSAGSAVPPTSAAAPSSQTSPRSNPADFAPALQPAVPDKGAGGASAGGLPLYAQIAAAPGAQLPRLHLDLHVYDPNPRKRFVMINMQKLRQGGSLADGVRVVKIRPDGVVLAYQGRKFLLPR